MWNPENILTHQRNGRYKTHQTEDSCGIAIKGKPWARAAKHIAIAGSWSTQVWCVSLSKWPFQRSKWEVPTIYLRAAAPAADPGTSNRGWHFFHMNTSTNGAGYEQKIGCSCCCCCYYCSSCCCCSCCSSCCSCETPCHWRTTTTAAAGVAHATKGLEDDCCCCFCCTKTRPHNPAGRGNTMALKDELVRESHQKSV